VRWRGLRDIRVRAAAADDHCCEERENRHERRSHGSTAGLGVLSAVRLPEHGLR
jgi:hypothetical protein